jgi:crotonobetainyl-CoA:carnitine CoA-transferase CaiB-like acyl-CoA transferase
MKLADEYGFPIGPVYRMDEVVNLVQFAHRRFFIEQPTESLGSIRVPNVPWQVHGRTQQQARPAPPLGAHTQRLLAELPP